MSEPAVSVIDGVLEEVATSFGLASVSIDDSFVDLRVNSVAVLRLMAALEKRFDIPLDLVDLFQAQAVDDLVELVTSSLDQRNGE
ncbi:acyl carrier protein [Streptomyces sp. NRRL S-1022]|uniref:acyl carrier protein n=1 Tax=Streptomyces sp. NRRL S-1022 TaxID=1463880 RepID=UPI0004C21C73|nr:acyl carrier protein [Streptomyces sp. NRRL S-1022]